MGGGAREPGMGGVAFCNILMAIPVRCVGPRRTVTVRKCPHLDSRRWERGVTGDPPLTAWAKSGQELGQHPEVGLRAEGARFDQSGP